MKVLSVIVAATLLMGVVGDGLASDAVPGVERGVVGWFRRTFQRLTWEEMKTVVKSPREASAVVRHAVRYREDFGDEWAGGGETWGRGFGDCEDMAITVVELCRAAGNDARVVVFNVRGSADGHAVAVGTIDGKFWLSSNGWHSTVRSMEEAKRVIARQMGWRGARVEVRDLDGELAMRVGSGIDVHP